MGSDKGPQSTAKREYKEMVSVNKTVSNKKQEKVVNLAFPEDIFRPSCGAFAMG